jgi:hypothetical protein
MLLQGHDGPLTSVILLVWEVEIGKMDVRGQLGQKVHEIPILTIGWTMWYMAVIPATAGSIK